MLSKAANEVEIHLQKLKGELGHFIEESEKQYAIIETKLTTVKTDISQFVKSAHEFCSHLGLEQNLANHEVRSKTLYEHVDEIYTNNKKLDDKIAVLESRPVPHPDCVTLDKLLTKVRPQE